MITETKEFEFELEFPKPFCITKWLVLSSCFFLVPAIYAFLHAHTILYGFLSIFTTICSINHWRCAEDGYRRQIDRVVAIIAFIIYFVTGCIYFPIYLSILTFTTIGLSFATSNYLSKIHHEYWALVHVLFHLSVSITKIIIIYYILDDFELIKKID